MRVGPPAPGRVASNALAGVGSPPLVITPTCGPARLPPMVGNHAGPRQRPITTPPRRRLTSHRLIFGFVEVRGRLPRSAHATNAALPPVGCHRPRPPGTARRGRLPDDDSEGEDPQRVEQRPDDEPPTGIFQGREERGGCGDEPVTTIKARALSIKDRRDRLPRPDRLRPGHHPQRHPGTGEHLGHHRTPASPRMRHSATLPRPPGGAVTAGRVLPLADAATMPGYTCASPAEAAPSMSPANPNACTGPSAPVPCRPCSAAVIAPQARIPKVKS